MADEASSQGYVRPPGSRVYAASPLILPRRPSQSSRGPRSTPELRDATTLEIRRQIEQVLALIRDTESVLAPQPTATESQNQELARSLQELELKLAERERAVEDREFKLADRERDLAEAEVLLKHHEALLSASRRAPTARVELSDEERTALNNLKTELDRQEALLKESRDELRAREEFIDESERRLFEKVQQQQEKETELEQREEDIRQREKETGLAKKTEPGAKTRAFDEFNE